MSDTSSPVVDEVVAGDGCRLHVERRGEGPAVLLIHAGAEDATGWEPQAAALAQAGFLAISYDRRGTGRSGRDGWPGDGAPAHARDAAAILDAVDLERATVLGVSSGAVVALELTLAHPERVSVAVIHEPPLFAHAEDGEQELTRLTEAAHAGLAKSPGDFAAAYAALMVAVNGPDVVERMGAARWAMEARNAEQFLSDDLPRIATRRFDDAELRALAGQVRLSCGAESPPFLRAVAANLAERGGWRHTVLAGQGHTPHLSDPAVFVDAVTKAAGGWGDG